MKLKFNFRISDNKVIEYSIDSDTICGVRIKNKGKQTDGAVYPDKNPVVIETTKSNHMTCDDFKDVISKINSALNN